MKLVTSLFLCIFAFAANAQEVPSTDVQPNAETPAVEVTSSSEPIPAENETATADSTPAEKPEPEVIYVGEKVFPHEFMKNLMACNPDTQSDEERRLEIVGQKNGNCLLKYADFDLNVPLTLLGNIHSFDDVETLLKNKDIAHYNHRADYIYSGLMYALNACFNKKNYDGKQDEITDEYVIIERGLDAEFINDVCTVYLRNTQNIDGIITDYGVTCTLPYKAVQELEPYFKNIAEQYGEKRGFSADGHITVTREQENKQTKEADIALMYYLQKNGYCKKNIQ